MTNQYPNDETLNGVAALAEAHLPTGTKASVHRGRHGAPHTLWVTAPGLVVSRDVEPGEVSHGPERSFQFYDRVDAVRWLKWQVESAYVELRDSSPPGAVSTEVGARLRDLSVRAGRLMDERHKAEHERRAGGWAGIEYLTVGPGGGAATEGDTVFGPANA